MGKDVEMIKGLMEYECITKTPYRESVLINHTLYCHRPPEKRQLVAGSNAIIT